MKFGRHWLTLLLWCFFLVFIPNFNNPFPVYLDKGNGNEKLYFQLLGTGMGMKTSFPIFGDGNGRRVWSRAGIPAHPCLNVIKVAKNNDGAGNLSQCSYCSFLAKIGIFSIYTYIQSYSTPWDLLRKI